MKLYEPGNQLTELRHPGARLQLLCSLRSMRAPSKAPSCRGVTIGRAPVARLVARKRLVCVTVRPVYVLETGLYLRVDLLAGL